MIGGNNNRTRRRWFFSSAADTSVTAGGVATHAGVTAVRNPAISSIGYSAVGFGIDVADKFVCAVRKFILSNDE